MSNDQPGTGQPSWQPSEGEQPQPYGQPPVAPPAPAYGQGYPAAPPPPAYGQGYPAAPAYGQGYPAAPAYGQGYAQNVAGPQLAGWGSRVGAYLIDNLIIGLPYGIGAIVSGVATASTATVDANGNLTGASPGGSAGLLLGGLLSLVLWVWIRGIQQGGTGQSIGKRAVGIRLLKEADGQPMGVAMALVRDIVHIVDSPFYLGYLWPLWDAKKQTFADKILTTVVVKG